MKISFIVSSYKSELTLERCLDSLVNQTLKEVEVICVNDGSPQRELQIMQAYQKKYPNKIVVFDKKNEGIWKARLDGFKLATGEYVTFIDSDDYINLEYANKMYEQARKDKSDIVICGFDRIDSRTGHIYSREMCKKKEIINLSKDLGELIMLNGALWNKIYKREILSEIFKLQSVPRILEDLIVLLFAYQNTKKISFVDSSLVYYMVNEGSNIDTIDMQKLETAYVSMAEIKSMYLLSTKHNARDLCKVLDAIAFLHFGVSMAFRRSCDKKVSIKEFVKQNNDYLDSYFGNWRSSKYLTLKYMITHKFITFKLWFPRQFYKIGVFNLFLKIYKFTIKNLKIDIKW